MSQENQDWQEIARELARERNPLKRRKLETALAAALERAGFQKFSRRAASTGEDEQSQKKR